MTLAEVKECTGDGADPGKRKRSIFKMIPTFHDATLRWAIKKEKEVLGEG